MCGIAAVYGGVEETVGSRMLDRLAHRGPDDEGSVAVAGNWLGHRRLAIVDLEGGRQPLTTTCGNIYMVGNGEIYNHEAVRQSLPNVEFLTGSDNEVALHLFDQRGPAAFSELLGMFAFVIAGKDGRFVAARDPVGIKPLYWARRGDQVRFASEMGAFDAPWRPAVEVFPPGHYWTPEDGLVAFATPVAPRQDMADGLDSRSADNTEVPDRVLDRVRAQLVSTVERQMMGDVPVGVFLSGGLDSSLVAAIAARWYRRRGQSLKTFAVGLADSPDLLAAREVAEHIGSEHHERIYTSADALRAVPDVVRVIESYDPSLVRSAVANYLLAAFAAEHVKVVLTGEGADEIFAGYEYLHACQTEEALHDELVRSIEGLHNLNLQRGDRVTMAHGLEARVPFLELDMIELGMSLPAAWKSVDDDRPEKWLLRKAFAGWLPEHLLWRKKAQFGDGSGAASVLRDVMAATVTDDAFARERITVDPALRSREEVAYYRIFREALEGIDPAQTVGLFVTA